MANEKINLSGFIGSQNYYKGFLNVKLTDGAYYLIENNCSWLISDICVIVKMEKNVSKEEFVYIKVTKDTDTTASVVYTDGNDKILYKQNYQYTDIWQYVDHNIIQFYYTDNVLMLSTEY